MRKAGAAAEREDVAMEWGKQLSLGVLSFVHPSKSSIQGCITFLQKGWLLSLVESEQSRE